MGNVWGHRPFRAVFRRSNQTPKNGQPVKKVRDEPNTEESTRKRGLVMSFNMLESTPEVAPLLVRLYDTHKLYGLAKDENPNARSELTTVMVDLLKINLNENEKELITDVLMTLMRQAETDLRMALADRLAVLDNVPLRMILHLANDDIIVADPVLRQSPVLQDMDLIYIIKAKGPEHWRAIARREALGSSVVDSLAETKDVVTAVLVTENSQNNISDKAMNTFTTLAMGSDTLARPLLMREDMPEALALKLYEYVGQELKQYILDHYDADAAQAASVALNDVTKEFREAVALRYTPSEQMIAAAELLMEKGSLKVDTMTQSLRRGQFGYFIALFSVYCGLSPLTVEQILKQESGQGLAVACRATSIIKNDFVSIYLLTNRLRNGGAKIVNQNELAGALRYFEKITTAQARKILSQSRQ